MPAIPSSLVIGLLASALGASLLYALRLIGPRGALAAAALGSAAVLLTGSFEVLYVITAFGALAVVASRIRRKLGTPSHSPRGIANVVANGVPGVLLLAIPGVPDELALLAFAASFASSTADTLASDLGGFSRRTVDILRPEVEVEAGRNGGVSSLGQAAAAFGAALIGLVAVLGNLATPFGGLLIGGLGFLGCQLDSVLGRTLERDLENLDRPLGKHDVNFISSLLAGATALLFGLLLP